MAEEKRKPDFEIDNERFCGRVYFGERSEEERMRIIKEATADFFTKILPDLIRLNLLEEYEVRDAT